MKKVIKEGTRRYFPGNEGYFFVYLKGEIQNKRTRI